MTTGDGAVILGLILIVISIPGIIINLYEWRRDRKLMRDGARTTGMIVEAVTYPHDDTVNTGQYRFIADFTDDKGVPSSAKSRFASRSPQSYMHKEVVIVYDKGNTDRSRFEVDISPGRDVLEKACVLLLGAALLLFGVYRQ